MLSSNHVRIPVFTKHSNPAIDPPILRKSPSYVKTLVSTGEADWYDASDETKGVIMRSRRGSVEEVNRMSMMAAGTMRSAWGVTESGYGGPLCWQMRRTRTVLAVTSL